MRNHSVIPVYVQDSALPTPDVRELALAAVDGEALPDFIPGAHVHVHHPSGMQRQYSLIGSPSDRSRYRIVIRRQDDGRGGSLAFHHALTVEARDLVTGRRDDHRHPRATPRLHRGLNRCHPSHRTPPCPPRRR